MPERCACGHPKSAHRYRGDNQYGEYTVLTACRHDDCACPDWSPVEGASRPSGTG